MKEKKGLVPALLTVICLYVALMLFMGFESLVASGAVIVAVAVAAFLVYRNKKLLDAIQSGFETNRGSILVAAAVSLSCCRCFF